jgi:HSP20 family molecular chaperone IbpA
MKDPAQEPTSGARVRVRPRTDVFETAEALVVVADVPGADRDSVDVLLQEDVLTLRARPDRRAPEGWKPAGAEFELPDYERSFRVTADIDREALEATLQNGRLRVVLKKRAPRPNRIEVRSG